MRNCSDDFAREVRLRVIVLMYADFGFHRGKGIEAYYTAKEAWKKGYLWEVIARDKIKGGLDFDLSLVETAIPLGNVIPRAFVAIERYVIKRFPSRLLGEILFDSWASHRLGKGDILYSPPRMVASLTRAKELGFVTALHCGELHPKWNLRMLQEEYSKLGMDTASPSWAKSMMDRYLESIKKADYLVVHSGFSKQTYINGGCPEDRILVNPLGVDLQRFQPIFTKDHSAIKYLFVGDMSIVKGVHYLLEAWQQLGLDGAKLTMCGTIHRDMQAIVARYRSQMDNIECPGYVDPAEYYQRSSVFVFPSLSEGFSKVVVEAMASGLPVIVTPPAAEAVRDGEDGFVIPSGDVEALKNKIMYFYNNRDEIERMGRNAREQAERYSWDAYSKRTVRILEDIWERESR